MLYVLPICCNQIHHICKMQSLCFACAVSGVQCPSAQVGMDNGVGSEWEVNPVEAFNTDLCYDVCVVPILLECVTRSRTATSCRCRSFIQVDSLPQNEAVRIIMFLNPQSMVPLLAAQVGLAAEDTRTQAMIQALFLNARSAGTTS